MTAENSFINDIVFNIHIIDRLLFTIPFLFSYTPLPHYNSETDRVHLMEASDSEEEDRVYDKDIMLRNL